MLSFPLLPVQASAGSSQLDLLFFALVGISAFFIILIFVLIVVFSIRYRKERVVDREIRRRDFAKLEVTWIVIPTLISLVIFGWSAWLYFENKTPPPDAMEIYVTGKQWMWKIQHQEGNREIDELHIPVNRPIKLMMTSQDVIHSFFIPAFRVKQDVLPGRYTTEWFTPTRIGEYHLFCAEYCGTNHSAMIGKIVVMDPVDYEHWLATSGTNETLASAGEQVFKKYGCAACHKDVGSTRGPSLMGLPGSTVSLIEGQTAVADREYLIESITDPGAKVVAGYKPIMPTYRTTLSPEQLNELVEYLLTLTGGQGNATRSN
ncbi:MAG: cytochrome c oxidase subunit II [Bacteroidota bacterium]